MSTVSTPNSTFASTAPKELDRTVLLHLYREMILIRRSRTDDSVDVPKSGTARLRPSLHRRRSGGHRRFGPSPAGRLDHQHASRARPRAGQGRSAQAAVGRIGRQGHRLQRRTRRHHARLHAVGGTVRNQRTGRRRNSRRPSDWPSAPRPAAPIRWPSPSSATERPATAPSTNRSISPAFRTRRSSSSAKTISTPRRRR